MAEKKAQDNGSSKNDALEVNQQFLSNQADSLGINIEKPKFPQYAVVAKRKDSYKNWPANLKIDTAVMIDAGLVYTGVGDSVRCYHCGGGLRNWEMTDDPWEEHAKWHPSCAHVKLVKGQDYIERVGRGEKPDTGCIPPSKKNDNQLLQSVPAQSCLENGFSEAMVLKAIKVFRENNHGSTEFRAADLAKIIMYLDDGGETDAAASNNETSPISNCCEKPDCDEICESCGRSQEYDAGVGDSDSDNDPWEVGRGEKPDPDCLHAKKDDNQLLRTVPAQSCLEFGYSEAMVLKAIKVFMENNHGSTEFKAADIAEIIMELEDGGVTDGAVHHLQAQKTDQNSGLILH